MKSINLLISYLGVFALLLTGLTSCDNETDPPVDESEIELSPDKFEVSWIGGSRDITVTTKPDNLRWTPEKSSGADWVSISETESGFSVTVAEWTTPADEPRKATVTVKATGAEPKVLKIEQTQKGIDPFLDLDVEDLDYPVQGGTKTVNVKTHDTWEVDSEESWIILMKRDTYFDVIVYQNEAKFPRSGVITVTAPDVEPIEIPVTQGYIEPVFKIDLEDLDLSYSYKARPESALFWIEELNVGYSVVLKADEDQNDPDWIRIDKDFWDDRYNFRMNENESEQARKATVTITPSSELLDPIVINITQRGVKIIPGPTVNATTWNFIADGEIKTSNITGTNITVTTGERFTWVTHSIDNGVLELIAEFNPYMVSRTEKVYLTTTPDEDSKGITELTLVQAEQTQEPAFNSHIATLQGVYRITAENVDGAPFEKVTSFKRYRDHSYIQTDEFYLYEPRNEWGRLDINRGSDGEITFIQNRNIGSFGNGSINCFFRMMCTTDPTLEDIHIFDQNLYSHAIINVAEKSFTFNETFVWEESFGEAAQAYDGQPLRWGYVVQPVAGRPTPVMALTNIKFQWIGPLEDE